MRFSEKLKKAMQELNLNQRQICGLTGKSKASVSQYLSGSQIPPEEVQKTIAVALGLDAEYFSKLDEEASAVRPSHYEDVFGTVHTKDIAKVMHAHVSTVAQGLQQGVFPWGYAVKKGVNQRTGKARYVYMINRKRFEEIEGVAIR